MVTAWTLDALEGVTEPSCVGGVSPVEDLASLTFFTPEMIQERVLEQLWFHRTHPRNEHNGSVLGAVIDALNIGCHSLSPFKVEGKVVDVNEDPLEGADVYLMRGDFRGVFSIQKTISGVDGGYLFYVDCSLDEFTVISFWWDASLGEYVRGVTDRDLKAVSV